MTVAELIEILGRFDDLNEVVLNVDNTTTNIISVRSVNVLKPPHYVKQRTGEKIFYYEGVRDGVAILITGGA
jgi:hypothetical protein